MDEMPSMHPVHLKRCLKQEAGPAIRQAFGEAECAASDPQETLLGDIYIMVTLPHHERRHQLIRNGPRC